MDNNTFEKIFKSANRIVNKANDDYIQGHEKFLKHEKLVDKNIKSRRRKIERYSK
ncbi:hypothetical protein [Convivina praedatoris]|uniref:hypothetical protein n=1 Tax=Convivina praedatoris TaxID=2880963 RepID=UPI00200BC6FA|nr:hypothetical protein [Convivina sp. LMG 32447]CAH1856246.1 hypothetical protein R077815_01358 [Convivina sp. LMG 32447]